MITKLVLDAMTRTQSDEQTFFRAAHLFCFGKEAEVSNDVAQFKLHCIVPAYVVRYVKTLLSM